MDKGKRGAPAPHGAICWIKVHNMSAPLDRASASASKLTRRHFVAVASMMDNTRMCADKRALQRKSGCRYCRETCHNFNSGH